MKRKVTVVGSTNIDMTMQLDHLPVKGETVTNGEYYQAFGGKGANQAVSAARSGADVTFITCLGNDNYTSLLLESFIKDNVQTQYVFVEDSVCTGTAIIMTDKQGNNYIGVAPGANDFLTPERLNKALPALTAADIVLLQCEIPLASNHFVMDVCHKIGKKVMLNLAPARLIENSYLSKLYMLVVNQNEAEYLVGTKITNDNEIKEAANFLLVKGVENIIITLGSRGSYVKTRSEGFFVNGYRVDAVDTTGAGDVFCGALSVAITEGKSIADAVKFATAAAAICVTRLGAQPSAPRRDDIIDFMKKHG